MRRGETINSWARPGRGPAFRPTRAVVAAVAGVVISLASAAVPALAATHAGGAEASHTRVNHRAHWAQMAIGGAHTCGIRTGGTLWCWGWNSDGQLGIGGHTDQDLPRQVTTPAAGGWASVTAGGYYTCATRTGGTLWCWGDGYSGQLGIGNNSSQDVPQQVATPAAGGWASVNADYAHTCATRTNRTLWCWGYNGEGELGIGSHVSQDRPRQVTSPAPGGWASVTAGYIHTCATRSNGTLWCWGWNGSGELGIGSHDLQDRPRQVTIPAAGEWASVTADDFHTCAARTGGTLWCWGDNYYGQLGIGNHTSQDRPRQVTIPAPAGWATVTAGSDHTCATRAGGTLWCWGYNDEGDLGIGNYISQDLPQVVTTPAARGWASVTAGFGGHTCATRTGGTLWCWGDNYYGQLGIGNRTGQDRPRQVTGCAHPGAQPRPARTLRTITRRAAAPATPGKRRPGPPAQNNGKDGDRAVEGRYFAVNA